MEDVGFRVKKEGRCILVQAVCMGQRNEVAIILCIISLFFFLISLSFFLSELLAFLPEGVVVGF